MCIYNKLCNIIITGKYTLINIGAFMLQGADEIYINILTFNTCRGMQLSL